MSVTGSDIWGVVDRLEKSLDAAYGQLRTLKEYLVQVDLPGPAAGAECEFCGPMKLPPATSLDDHMRNVHGVNRDAVDPELVDAAHRLVESGRPLAGDEATDAAHAFLEAAEPDDGEA